MRCHILLRLALFAGVCCAGPCVFLLSAQNTPIVLVQDAQGRQVYVNPGTSATPAVSSFARLMKPAAAGPQTPVPPRIQSLIDQTAGRFQVDPKLVNAIIRVESGFNTRAVSSKGAEGLMQLIPATAERFGVADPFNSQQNIQGGVTYLRYLLDRFNGSVPLSLAAYNAGENRVDRDQGIPAIPETINYVRKVTSLYRQGAVSQAHPSAHAALAESHGGDAPIYRYVDAWGVAHYAND